VEALALNFFDRLWSRRFHNTTACISIFYFRFSVFRVLSGHTHRREVYKEAITTMKILTRFCLIALLLCAAAFAQNATTKNFRALHIDATKVTGEIKSFRGLNGPPSPIMAGLPSLVTQYKALRVDQVRTHDFMGATEIDSKYELSHSNLTWLIPDDAQRAGVVKAGNASIIFPKESADPENPASYNFVPTDKALAAIHSSGAEVFYRIGRSWGANTNPPADCDKYASVVKHIAMHYNQGWANGYRYKIRYWEF
jgi:hypothetical protein